MPPGSRYYHVVCKYYVVVWPLRIKRVPVTNECEDLELREQCRSLDQVLNKQCTKTPAQKLIDLTKLWVLILSTEHDLMQKNMFSGNKGYLQFYVVKVVHEVCTAHR